MANAKISELPAVTAAAGSDLAVAVASGTTSQISVDNLFTDRTINNPTLTGGAQLGTPDSGTLTNCTGLPISTGVAGLGSNVATFLATPSSANLAAAVTGETGSGALVFATSPTLVTPLLGTPTSGTLTNCTLPVGGVTGMGTGVATFLATPSSANLASAVTDETGTGALVFGTGPTISAPVLTLKSYTYTQLAALTPAAGDVARVTAANAGLTWGDPIAEGSGDTAYMVWYNGAAWTVTGK